MKVLFLDVDGVLNYEGCDSYFGSVLFVVEEKVRLLADIISETDARIVLTSTWREGYYDMLGQEESFDSCLYEALVDKLEENDLYIHDCIGRNGKTRGEQIELWIKDSEEDIESFVILDDMNAEEFGQYADYLVQTDSGIGLEEYHVKAVIQILNEE